jgi:hypothetical protein
MCLLCDDQTVYQAYMAYVAEMERQGQEFDPDKAMDAALDAVERAERKIVRDTPANDKTLSPFFCSPVDR